LHSHSREKVRFWELAYKDIPICGHVFSLLDKKNDGNGEKLVFLCLFPSSHRQKEAGNINSSLLVLGRCIKAIRYVVSTTQYYTK
jgi:hypothetical protein